MTKMNDIPFSAKHHVAFSLVRAIPPSTGPITRARLNWMEFSAMALGKSSFSTNIGTRAEYAGPPNDCAVPTINERVRMCQTRTTPIAASEARVNAQVSCTHCDPSNRRRRLTRSATTPPISENRKIGMLPRKASSPSMRAEPEILYTSQLCATICIHVPMLDVQAPNQSTRKSR